MASRRNSPWPGRSQFYGLATGFALIAAGYPSSFIAGIFLNPAASLGLGIIAGSVKWAFVYSLWEIAGAVVAAVCFFFCRPEDFAWRGHQDARQLIADFRPVPELRAL